MTLIYYDYRRFFDGVNQSVNRGTTRLAVRPKHRRKTCLMLSSESNIPRTGMAAVTPWVPYLGI